MYTIKVYKNHFFVIEKKTYVNLMYGKHRYFFKIQKH